jgi:hypothetical protein
MISEMERARHAEQRGTILQALRSDYRSRMTSVNSLRGALYLVAQTVTGDSLQFHLSLLADTGYVKIWRAEDLPGFRPDREMNMPADRIVFARLTPKGLQLIDGAIEADPSVSF